MKNSSKKRDRESHYIKDYSNNYDQLSKKQLIAKFIELFPDMENKINRSN